MIAEMAGYCGSQEILLRFGEYLALFFCKDLRGYGIFFFGMCAH